MQMLLLFFIYTAFNFSCSAHNNTLTDAIEHHDLEQVLKLVNNSTVHLFDAGQQQAILEDAYRSVDKYIVFGKTLFCVGCISALLALMELVYAATCQIPDKHEHLLHMLFFLGISAIAGSLFACEFVCKVPAHAQTIFIHLNQHFRNMHI